MPHKKIAKLAIIMIPLVGIFCFYACCMADNQGRREIMSLDISDSKNLQILNRYLCEGEIWNYLAVRQKLLTLPYEKLLSLRESIVNQESSEKIICLTENIIGSLEKHGLYYLKEDIFINNIPDLIESPFYTRSSGKPEITKLIPQAEYIYLPNLRLDYRKNYLSEKENNLWVSTSNVPKQKNATDNYANLPKSVSSNQLPNEARKRWFYGVKEDNLTDYYSDRRKWIKRYEDNAIFPTIFNDSVIIRNFWRIFCIDLASGKEIWSFANKENNGQEFYQTLRHRYHNSLDYYLLRTKNTIYTVLSGKLVALNIKKDSSAQLLWEEPLGEYALCTKPIQYGDTVIAGLINSRGEFWICGFDAKKGGLRWSTYIGLSSFFSQSCGLNTIDNNLVYIGTNHGVLVCLNGDNGDIVWLKKYTSKIYSLFEYWEAGYYNSAINNTSNIKYDTQFLELDGDLLYYKPRESDCLYILKAKTGQSLDEVLVDSSQYYLLGVLGKRICFLKKTKSAGEKTELIFVDLNSGRQIQSLIINGGNLEGVICLKRQELIFKLGDTIHFLTLDKEQVYDKELMVRQEGYLLGFEGSLLFIGRDRQLYCFDIFGKNSAGHQKYSLPNKYLAHQEEVADALLRACQINIGSNEALRLRKRIIAGVSEKDIHLDKIIPIILDNLKVLRQPFWQDLIISLHRNYGDNIVTYQDVKMRLNNLLYRIGMPRTSVTKSPDSVQEGQVLGKEYEIKGERTFILPINVIKGSGQPNYYLLFNNDQLICVNEAGQVRWETKLFYFQFLGFGFDRNPEAYLFDNILIINDSINIVALDPASGKYVWSKSFIQTKQPTAKPGFYTSSMTIYTKFVDNTLVVVHKNKVYAIDPFTGCCDSSVQLNEKSLITGVSVSDNRIYVLFSSHSLKLGILETFNKNLKLLKEVDLGFATKKDTVMAQLLCADGHIILRIKNKVYMLDREGHVLKNNSNIKDVDQKYSFDVYKGSLLRVQPFYKIESYRFDKGSLVINWRYSLDSDAKYSIRYAGKESAYHCIINDKILLPYRRADTYYIDCVNLLTGKRLWRQALVWTKGPLSNLSNANEINGTINFIISAVYKGYGKYYYDNGNYCKEPAVGVYIISRLVRLNSKDGTIKSIHSLPSVQEKDFRKIVLSDTENYSLYGIYGKLIKAERK